MVGSEIDNIVATWWPLVVAIFGAGLGWGVHQVTLSVLGRQLTKLETRVDRMEVQVGEISKTLAGIDSKLDMLLASCPAVNVDRGSCSR